MESSINVIDLLGITYDENIISNLIVGLINHSMNFRKAFLQNIVDINRTGQYSIKAFTRNEELEGRPNIIIIAESSKKIIISFIKCILKSEKATNNWAKYSEEDCINEIFPLCNVKLSDREIERKFVYLSTKDLHYTVSDKYITKTFRELVEKVNVDIEDYILDKMYKDFCLKILEFYSRNELIGNAKLLDIISLDQEIVGIRFRELILSLEFPNYFKMTFVPNDDKEREGKFSFEVSKKEWIGGEAKWNGIEYEMTSDTYDVHIYSEIDVKNLALALMIHYEPYPYISRKALIYHSTANGYLEFENKRDRTKERLEKILKHNRIGQVEEYYGVNGIFRIKYNIDSEITINEFKNKACRHIVELSKIIDEALKSTTTNKI